MFSSLITKHINDRRKNSFHVIGLHDITAMWVKRRCAKFENLPTQKSYPMYTLTVRYCILLNFTEFLKTISKFMNFAEF